MNYILPSEYAAYGLDDTTPAALVAAASVLIDAHCHRPTLAVAEYTERLRIATCNTVRLTYLPLTTDVSSSSSQNGPPPPPPPEGSSPFAAARVRYASAARECSDFTAAVAQAFALPGSWTDLDPLSLDYDAQTGELTLPVNVLGLPYAELEITYRAGFAILPDAAKIACAHLVRNALATPALNVRAANIEPMHMDYFADSLLTSDIRKLLAPFVARRVG